MALKIISGVILPSPDFRTSGSLVLDLESGTPIPTEAADFAQLVVTGVGVFDREPAKVLAVRGWSADDRDKWQPAPFSAMFAQRNFNLNDNFLLFQGLFRWLQISWGCGNRCTIREISVLVVGESSD